MPRVVNDENVPILNDSSPRITPRKSKASSTSKILNNNKSQFSPMREDSEEMVVEEEEMDISGIEIEVQAPTSENADNSSRRSVSVRRSSRAPSLGITTSSLASTSLQPMDPPTPKTRARSTSVKPSTTKPTSTPKKVMKPRAKSKSARPSETLHSAPATPDSDSEDPLLLRGGEEMRGWGEGKPAREGSWGGISHGIRSRENSMVREGSATKRRRRSVSARQSTLTPDREFGDERRQKDDDWGAYFDGPEFEEVPVVTQSRDYEVPVHFTSSPASKNRNILRRPSSPAPLQSFQHSSPIPSPVKVVSPIKSTGLEEEIIEPKVEEEWKDGVDFFGSESSSVEEQEVAEKERWDGPPMSEDSIDSVSEDGAELELEMEVDAEIVNSDQEDIIDEVSLAIAAEAEFEEMEETDQEERTFSPAPSDTATTPRHSPSLSSPQPKEIELEVTSATKPIDTFSKSAAPSLPDAELLQHHSTQHIPLASTQLSNNLLPSQLSFPASLPPTPLLHFSRRQSTVLPTPQHANSTSTKSPSNSILTSGRRGSGRRVSHPFLPVVQIFSEDPRAAAEATAFLKLRHGYQEDGLEFEGLSEVRDDEDEVRRRESGKGPRKSLAEREAKMKALLNQAENELRQGDPPLQSSIRREVGNPVASTSASVLKSINKTTAELQTEQIPFNFDRKWSSSDWRSLEQALVDERILAKTDGRDLRVEDIIWGYLDSQVLEEDDLEGDWVWDKLATRVGALQQRRARDSASRASSRASSVAPSEIAPRMQPLPTSSIMEKISEVVRGVRGNTQRMYSEVEEIVEEELVEEDEEDQGQEDTFYGQSIKQGKTISTPTIPLLALKSSRHAHLFDERIEKPRVEEWSGGFRIKTEELEDNFVPSEDSQEAIEVVKSGSARKLFSYLGSLVKRANDAASPTPSPPPSPGRHSASPTFESSSPPFEPLQHRSTNNSLPRPSPKLPARLTQHLPIRPPAPTALQLQQTRNRLSNGSSVQESIIRIEDAENSREVNVIPFDLTQIASGSRGSGRKRGAEEELHRGKKGSFIPAGTRALDRSF